MHGTVIEMDALKEQVGGMVGGLFGIGNGTAVAVEELGKGGDNAFLVGAVDTEGPIFAGTET